MIARFCAYAVLRNLRFFEPFFLLFLLHDVGVDFVAAGALLAYEKLLGGALEVPLGVVTDRLGRRRALIASFSLAAAAFAVFAWAAHTRAWTLPLLYLGQTLYAVAEAARSGSHKAIILDWLTQQGRRGEKTRVIGTTRFFSKASGGAAALIAGSIVWGTGHFTALFWAAMVPTLGAAALLWTYPRSVEGSLSQRPPESPEGPGLWAGLAQAAKRPGLLGLVAASVLFESQSKLALVYLQPYLAARLAAVELPVAAGVGAVIYGAWFFIQGLLAGSASLLAPRVEAATGDAAAALRPLHRAAAAALLTLAGLALAADGAVALIGLPLFAALAALQNLRRPLFLTALDDRMDGAWRATTLSAETQLRGWAYAASALVAGVLADGPGVPWAFAWMALLMAAAAGLAGRLTGGRSAAEPLAQAAVGGGQQDP